MKPNPFVALYHFTVPISSTLTSGAGRSEGDLKLARGVIHSACTKLFGSCTDNSNFRGFVDFLRTELDRAGPAHADLCRDFFSRAVALELSFFEAAYTT
jgi:hypothetical protein